MKKFLNALCFLLLITFFQLTAQPLIPDYLNPDKSIEVRIGNALSLMTLEEKVALCHAQSQFSSAGVPRLGIPEINYSDGPNGVRQELMNNSYAAANWRNDSCTGFPALTCLSATFNPLIAYDYGVAMGEEALYRKKDVLLSPGVNIFRTPMNGRNFEFMGEDPFLTGQMAVPVIKGIQSNGVAACVKSVALSNQETNRKYINVMVSDRALHEIYLPAFKTAVEDGKSWTVMGSYSRLRGQYCCQNDLLLNKIIKKDWNFDGVILADWGGVHDTRESALNGLDVEMGTNTDGNLSKYDDYNNYNLGFPFLRLLKNGEIPLSVIDDKCRRILRLIMRTSMNHKRGFGKFVCEDHSTIARKVAEEGIVLLKNQNNLLPIQKGKYKKIAVIGENAIRNLTAAGGSSELKVKYEVSPLEGLKAKFGKENITFSYGYSAGPNTWGKVVDSKLDKDSLFKAAVETARNADIVLFVGGLNKSWFQESEGSDRKSYNLPYNQDELIEAIQNVNKKTVVLLLSGNAVAMPWLQKVSALLQCWYIGSEAGNAIANIISGEINPSGKLPFSFPKKLEDNGAMFYGKKSYPGDSVVHYMEDILVGYRWYDTKKITPQFPFGYGLSYTSFEYGKIITDKKNYKTNETITLSFTLKNTGKTDGSEATQVYATQPKASVLRPAKELKAFRKVFLRAGEIQVVEMKLKVKDLAFYDDRTQAWKVEPGEFILRNASSAADIKSSISITVSN